jgi:hypothetical protein
MSASASQAIEVKAQNNSVLERANLLDAATMRQNYIK